MGGRPPKNPKTLELEKGRLYGKQKERAENLLKTVNTPKCPAGFNNEQRKVWRHCANILKENGILASVNGPLLKEWAYWEWVLAGVRERVDSIDDLIGSSEAGKNPHTAESALHKQASEQVLKIYKSLGLGTVDSAKVGNMLIDIDVKKKSSVDAILD